MGKQKDGRYRAKVNVGMRGFEPIYKYISGRTKKELEEKKQAVLGGQSLNQYSFGDYAELWFELYKEPNLGVSAKMAYRTALNKHILPILGNKYLASVTTEDLQALLNSKANTCSTIIGNVRAILFAVCKRAYSQGLMPRDITVGVDVPHKAKESRRALTEAETAAVLQLIPDEPMLALLYYTGMRYGEACGLQYKHIDFKNKVIHIEQQAAAKANEITAPKTRKSVRDIPLPDALHLNRGLPNAFVVPAPDGSFYKNTARYRLWDDIAAKLYEIDPTIEAEEKGGRMISVITPHYLRHNYASILYNAGIDAVAAQHLLGHTSVKITLDIYSHISEEKKKVSSDMLQAAFNQKLPKSCQQNEG